MTDLSKIPLPEGWGRVLLGGDKFKAFMTMPKRAIVCSIDLDGDMLVHVRPNVEGGWRHIADEHQSDALRAFTEAVEIAKAVRDANKEST